MQLKLGFHQSGSFHPASQTKIGLPPAVRMLPSPRKLKNNRLAMKEGGFLEVAGGNRGGLGASQQHRQPLADPPSPDSTDPKNSAFSNVTFTSSKLSTVRTLNRRTSWAPRRNNTEATAPSSKEPLLTSTPSFWEWVAPSTIITRWTLLRSWVLIF